MMTCQGKALAANPNPGQYRDMTAAPLDMTELLARWGIQAHAELLRTERGTNNQTFAVVLGPQRWALRITENLSPEQVHAEHRLLARLREPGLPFGIPEPVPTLAGDTVTETPNGPATLCRWLPGVPPELTDEQPMERFGRAIALLSDAMRPVPSQDAPHDWRGDPLCPHPDMPGVPEVARELPPEHAAVLETGALRVATWWSRAGRDLPVQVVHGDPAASNTLVGERTGQVTALLDFEIAGADFRVQDLVAALTQTPALDAPNWPSLVTAMMRGHASVLRLDPAELEAVPDLLIARCVGSVLWRAGRWHRGQARRAEVIDRISQLEATITWLDASADQLRDIMVSNNQLIRTFRRSPPSPRHPARAARTSPASSLSPMAAASCGRSLIVPGPVLSSGCRAVKPSSRSPQP
jgi:homoserine kinase type II